VIYSIQTPTAFIWPTMNMPTNTKLMRRTTYATALPYRSSMNPISVWAPVRRAKGATRTMNMAMESAKGTRMPM